LAAMAYSRLAKKFSNQEEISEAFSLLAADEMRHRAQFKGLLDELPPEADNVPQVEKRLYLSAMASSEFFTGEAGITATLEKIQTVNEALVHVLGFEKATLGFYRAIQDTLGQEAALDAIIAAEQQHIARLMKYILTEEKMKGLGDDS
jgi:rubrerythrin